VAATQPRRRFGGVKAEPQRGLRAKHGRVRPVQAIDHHHGKGIGGLLLSLRHRQAEEVDQRMRDLMVEREDQVRAQEGPLARILRRRRARQRKRQGKGAQRRQCSPSRVSGV
jgi:hypothetical protein